MPDHPKPPARPAPLGRLPTRSFRQPAAAAKPAPLPKANTPPPTTGSKFGMPAYPTTSAVVVSIEHDVACGILVGVFDPGPHTVTVEAITEVDPTTRAQTVQKDWLKPNDIVGALTRMYLAAKQTVTDMSVRSDIPAAQRPQQAKARDEAVARHQELKRQVYDVLRFRDVLERAQKAGYRVIYTPPEQQVAAAKRSGK